MEKKRPRPFDFDQACTVMKRAVMKGMEMIREQEKLLELEEARKRQQKLSISEFRYSCAVINSAIKRANNIVRHQQNQFTSEQYMKAHTAVYNLCTRPINSRSKTIHNKYCKTLADNIKSTIMPSLREKHGEFMLADLSKSWLDYKLWSKLLHRFFYYLDRSYIKTNSLEPLAVTALRLFRELCFEEIKGRATDAMLIMINREREGGLIDRSLLKNTLSIYVDVDGVTKTPDRKSTDIYESYEEGFEDSFLRDTAEYYSRKSSVWILEDSCVDYIRRAKDCMRLEKERVSHYLLPRTESSLLSVVRKALIREHWNQLMEGGIAGLEVDDLSRVYNLCSEVQLEHINDKIFRNHMTAYQGTGLVQQEGDLVQNRSMENTESS